VEDVTFQVDGVTYVVPTPAMGKESRFFAHGRPRKNSTGIETSPPVATVFAGLSHCEWGEFRRFHPDEVRYPEYSEWKKLEVRAKAESDLKPFVVVPVTHAGWWEWVQDQPGGLDISVHRYATDLFHVKIMQVIEGARERKIGMVLPGATY